MTASGKDKEDKEKMRPEIRREIRREIRTITPHGGYFIAGTNAAASNFH